MTVSPAVRYGVAAAAVAVCLLARIAVEPLWGPRLPFLTFFAAVMVAGWLGGFGPGLAATLAGALLGEYFFIAPRGSFAIESAGDLLGLLLFVVIGVLMSGLNEAWRRADRARAAAEREQRAALDREREARAESETAARRLELALEAGRLGTWQWTPADGRLQWSPGLEAIHGYPAGTFPGTFEAFRGEIHPEDRERVEAAIAEAAGGRRDHRIEYRIVRRDGAVRWVEGRGLVLRDARGEPERMIGVCSDVTDRRRAEERFRLAIEAAPTAILIVDADGLVVHANAMAEQLLGYSGEELTGLPIDRLVPAPERDRHAEYRATFARAPARRPMGVGRELRALRKNGTEVPVEIGLSPIETSDGSLVLTAITDISARKLAEAAGTAAREDAERANRLKDEFLSVLSHELRTPLNATLGWASLLAAGDLDLETSRRAIEAIERNARAEARLVDALLDLSRVISGKLELERARMDLAELVRVAGESLRPDAESKGIVLTVAGTEAGPLPVVGDWNRLQQVIWNLLSNALKFTPRGGHVELCVGRAGECAQIEVRDDGKGIRAEFLPRVFERFSQEATAGSARVGLGLGLAIVKELAQAHGGTVAAHSEGDGCGSRFTVSLPLAPTLPSVPAGIEPVPSLAGLDLLVVEDDAEALEVFARLLRARGADVRTATTAAEALHLVRGRRPHLVLTDLRMPRVDGYALLEMLRLAGGAPIPAVAVSAEAGEAERSRALAAGFVAHVGKPVEPAELVTVVAAHARRAPG